MRAGRARFRAVVTDYQTTAHVEEALMRLTEAYMALGIAGEAEHGGCRLCRHPPQHLSVRIPELSLANGQRDRSGSDGDWYGDD